MNNRAKVLSAIMLISLATICAGSSLAGDGENSRQGFYVGINSGGGTSGLAFTENETEKTMEGKSGCLGMFRAGYGINESFLVGIHSSTFESDHDGERMDFSTVALTGTWHPRGSGFFVRLGVGGGQAEAVFDLDGQHYEFDETGACGTFGIGLEEWLSSDWCLGLALDAQGIGFDDFDDLSEAAVGFGSATIQLSWYP